MIITQSLTQIFKVLKKWLSRLTQSSVNLVVSLLSLLRHFATRSSRPGNLPTRIFTGALQGNVAGKDPPICSSLLPPGQMSLEVQLEVAGDHPSPSDDPYSRTHARPLRKSTEIPSPEAGKITKAYPSAAEPYQLSSDSVSTLHLSQQAGASQSHPPSPKIPYHQKGKGVDPGERGGKESSVDNRSPSRPPLQVSGSPGQSPLLGPHGLSTPNLRTPSLNSGISRYSSARSIAGSDTRQAEYRTHTESVHSRPVSVRSSFADLHIAPVPGIDRRYHVTAPPDSNEQPGPGVMEYEGPPIGVMVADGVKRYEKCIPRNDDVSDTMVPAMTIAFPVHECLFWLDEFDAKKVLSDCKGITNLSHKGLTIQAQYCIPVAQTLVDEVKNMLVHAKCDHLTSKQSSAAYDVNELRDYLDIVTRITVCPTANQSMEKCHVVIIIGRIMNTFSHNAFINFHGENCARLSFEQTVHGWAYIRSWWMVVFTAVLFLEPETQVQELHKIFADKITRTSRWNAFSSKLKSLNKGGRSVIQTASYMSLVTSLGSIVLGLFFASQGRTSGQSTADEAASFLGDLHDEAHGLESLAMIYSLPKALLMWGMVFFFVAFSMYWCTSGDEPSEVAVATVTLLVFVAIALSIIRTKEGDGWGPPNLALLSHIFNAWKRGVEVTRIKRAQRHGLELLSHLANTWKRGIEFMTMRRRNDDIVLVPMRMTGGPSSHGSDADVDSLRSPSRSSVSPHPISPISTTSIPVHSSHQSGDSNSMLHSVHLHRSPSVVSGVGSSEHERQTAANSGAPTSTVLLRTEESEGVDYTEIMVEDPQELEITQARESPPPTIMVRSATGDAQRMLQDSEIVEY
ncbi:hypothetical protein AZE42_07368 [Rhizopogon vesiculosus]|uniref:Uncharacterized protein n=1 Tax=Rhizopogon vesiculosus TaxID=180088 RepID=A0A1J8QAX4_9AGAM|nr:hypothetical protein AZE42_07368 [Rhizopogon vesiculosus]